MSNSQLMLAGVFHDELIRNGKVIASGRTKNIYVNEGLINALNVTFSNVLTGAPAPSAAFYIGLTAANRTWQATDSGDDSSGTGIHTVGQEIQDYDETSRQMWTPQGLATTTAIQLSNAGAEVTFTMNNFVTAYGAFLINKSAKTGADDIAGTVLVAGSNFTNPRALEPGDIYKVGYTLSAQSGV